MKSKWRASNLQDKVTASSFCSLFTKHLIHQHPFHLSAMGMMNETSLKSLPPLAPMARRRVIGWEDQQADWSREEETGSVSQQYPKDKQGERSKLRGLLGICLSRRHGMLLGSEMEEEKRNLGKEWIKNNEGKGTKQIPLLWLKAHVSLGARYSRQGVGLGRTSDTEMPMVGYFSQKHSSKQINPFSPFWKLRRYPWGSFQLSFYLPF